MIIWLFLILILFFYIEKFKLPIYWTSLLRIIIPPDNVQIHKGKGREGWELEQVNESNLTKILKPDTSEKNDGPISEYRQKYPCFTRVWD